MPFPLPLPGEVIAIQLSLLSAFQVQPFDVTLTVPVPPAIGKLFEDVAIE